MRMSARVHNSQGQHHVDVVIDNRSNTLSIAPKSSGLGSSVSGGELLMAALATCYCNDLYREAASMGIEVTGIEVECEADFPAIGAPAQDLRYSAVISARASEEEIRDLAARVDRVSEIQNTVRQAIPVSLSRIEVQVV